MIRTLSTLALTVFLTACGTSKMQESARTLGSIEKLDPRLDKLLPPGARLEILSEGHKWTEGPVWVPQGRFLLFSDIPPNRVFRWKEGEGARPYLQPSGYTGTKPRTAETDEPGSNGLVLDPQGRLVLCQHGDRRVARMNAPLDKPDARFVTLADRYMGKRLNSPNDAVFHSGGSLYFTDPPYGLEKRMEDPEKELDFQGVYRVTPGGELTLLTKEITRPNGIAFSPDEKKLYVASSDPDRAIWMVYDVKPGGMLANGKLFFDATKWVKTKKGLPDGLKVDVNGNLFATGPGGVLVFAPDGTHLGTINTGEKTANCAWGDDGATLYIAADMYLLRIRTGTKGKGF